MIQAASDRTHLAEATLGRVVAVCVSRGSIPKHMLSAARVAHGGLQGDGHAHAKHNRPERAVSLFDLEILTQLQSEGFPLYPGAIGENLTVAGLHVQSLPPGTLLEIGDVLLRLEEPRKPCYVLDAISPCLKDVIVGRCGYMASVLEGGMIRPNMEIIVTSDDRARLDPAARGTIGQAFGGTAEYGTMRGQTVDVLSSFCSITEQSSWRTNARHGTTSPRCCWAMWIGAWIIPVIVALAGCSSATTASNDDELPDSLAALQLFDGHLARLIPARGVTAYEINSPSFSDYARSHFVMKLPPGASIRYMPDGPFEFPVGTVLAQTLSYADADRDGARRIVETRVLLRREDKWIALPYLWNDEQTDARLELIGARIEIHRRRADGEVRQQTHIVPNFNDCKRCHRIGDIVTPIAAGVRQLNCLPPASDSALGQLARWQGQGLLQGLPPGDDLPRLSCWNDPTTGTVEQRARAWLDANCAHCHNPRGTAANSGLQLAVEVERASAFGVLKTPVAAGRGTGGLHFDILPGQPKASIILYRVRSVEGGIMMPEFGRTQIDEEGAALLSEWIESMSPVEQALGQTGLIGIVADVKPDELSTFAQQALTQGDPKRGEEVFQRQELNCTKCHAISGKGANVGPDLATLGTQIKPEHVVESILLPDRIIKEGFRAISLQTEDGRVVTGIQVLDDGHDVVLRDPVRGDTRISKAEIAESSLGGSLMPANLVAAISRDEFLDLVRYLVELNHHDETTQSLQSGSP